MLFFLTLNFNSKSLYVPEESSSENHFPDNETLPPDMSEKTSRPQTSPTLAFAFSHRQEHSSVVISGPRAQALLEVVARHALRKSIPGGVTLHNLDRGTRVSIVTEAPPDDCVAAGQKKTRQ